MPRVDTRKLYSLLKPKLQEEGIKLGRDALFDYLRDEQVRVKPKRSFTKTINSRHWMKKHPNLLKDYKPRHPKDVLVSEGAELKWGINESAHYWLTQ
ncbi:hypothetical protein [Vibrio mytili]|uniref:hypothetical protein n=1 Tax=Vibrio mytili TaxID=50718 RepID=UPI0038B5C785